MAEIRRVRPDDWEGLRTVRLAALLESPTAFATRYDEAVQYSDELWQERALLGSEGTNQATFLLVDRETAVGMVTGLRRPANDVLLVGMWVDPGYRRAGHGEQLVRELVAWAGGIGASAVRLGVTVGNRAAQALYQSCGFDLTGQQRSLPGHPGVVEHTMELRFSDA